MNCNINTGWKIVEKYDKGLRSLFHGTNGTRHFPVNEWMTAQIRENASDGTSKTKYRSGYHILSTKDECLAYLDRFNRRLDKLVIVEVEYRGEIWEKTHSHANVLLVEQMKIIR